MAPLEIRLVEVGLQHKMIGSAADVVLDGDPHVPDELVQQCMLCGDRSFQSVSAASEHRLVLRGVTDVVEEDGQKKESAFDPSSTCLTRFPSLS